MQGIPNLLPTYYCIYLSTYLRTARALSRITTYYFPVLYCLCVSFRVASLKVLGFDIRAVHYTTYLNWIFTLDTAVTCRYSLALALDSA
jgi:hypothetical protein